MALEAIKERETLAQIAQKYDLQPVQVSKWKKEFKDNMSSVFENPRKDVKKEQETKEAQLYEQIGRLKMELEWLKKKLNPSMTEKRAMVEPNHSELSVKRQCELLELARSSDYYEPAQESRLNLRIMRLIDEHYMNNSSWGVRRMTAWLDSSHKIKVNEKRVGRLMKLMGLRGLVPRRKKHTSIRASEHQVFPYLLGSMNIASVNQAWGSDVTYIPMKQGFMC